MSRLDITIDGDVTIGDRAIPNFVVALSLSVKSAPCLGEHFFQVAGITRPMRLSNVEGALFFVMEVQRHVGLVRLNGTVQFEKLRN